MAAMLGGVVDSGFGFDGSREKESAEEASVLTGCQNLAAKVAAACAAGFCSKDERMRLEIEDETWRTGV
ncbi:hypothetical protein HanRHA438_Chr09g0410861 [Helianthus annuus]|nr:hypothetical protein HanRHA438_Chr09g0410861 [Helianthus annuus]